MRESFTILIADRNHNIREFLKRELENEGYLIQLANNGLEVVKIIAANPPDLLILDLDMTYLNGLEILDQIQNIKHSIPIVIHTLLTTYRNHPVVQKNTVVFFEKNGNNINNLKEKIVEILVRYYPNKFTKYQKRTYIVLPSRSL